VSNCPGKNAIAVAELAFGLMLALDRRIARERHDIQIQPRAAERKLLAHYDYRARWG